MSTIKRFARLFGREQLEHELSDELRFHVEQQTALNIQKGMTAEEARFAALRAFGGVEQIKEESRDLRGIRILNDLIQDLRFGLRTLAKSPGFTAVAVLTLALGIGANTAIFSLIDAVMLRSLPARDPSQLVLLRWSVREGPRGSIEMSSFGDCPEGSMGKSPSGCTFPYPVFEQIATEKEYFSEASAFAGPAQLVLAGHGAARMASGELVSGDYFSTLGVNAVVGRTLGREDDSLSAVPAVVLSYRFWQSEFGGDRSAVGRSISLNGV